MRKKQRSYLVYRNGEPYLFPGVTEREVNEKISNYEDIQRFCGRGVDIYLIFTAIATGIIYEGVPCKNMSILIKKNGISIFINDKYIFTAKEFCKGYERWWRLLDNEVNR